MNAPQILVEDVGFSYGKTPVLSQCNMALATGVTALVGRNGAGKTTLIRLLATVTQPDAGSVHVDGVDIWGSDQSLKAYRRVLGWVPQKVSVPRGLTTRDYLRHLGWLHGLNRPEIAKECQRVSTLLELEEFESTPMHRLSGGTYQRIVLAGALLGRPRHLFLDEPTVGLDPVQRRAYLGLVRETAQDAVVLISTHLLEDVAACAQRVLVLEGGCIRADRTLPLVGEPAEHSWGSDLMELLTP